MDSPLSDLFYNFGAKIIGYLPSLLAGVLLLGVGWFLGWIGKRIIIQLCVILRLEHLLRGFRWGKEFSKADIRYAVLNGIGNIGFFLIFLIFLNAALDAMQLFVLSTLIQKGVLFFPRLFISAIIVGVGWVLAGVIATSIQRALMKEDVPRATLVSRFSKAVLVLFFSSMALVELDIARDVVIVGFTTTIITLGIISVLFTWLGGKTLVGKIVQKMDKE